MVLLTVLSAALFSQTKNPGIISGRVINTQSQRPVEYANMVLLDSLSGKMATGIVSDSNGYFILINVPFGSYVMEYSFVGYEKNVPHPLG